MNLDAFEATRGAVRDEPAAGQGTFTTVTAAERTSPMYDNVANGASICVQLQHVGQPVEA